MKNLLVKIYNQSGPGLRRSINSIRTFPDYVSWCLESSGRRAFISAPSLARNTMQGKRVILIGNGPSLNLIPHSLLENEYLIGLNRIYLKFEEWGFPVDYLCCFNNTVLRQFQAEFKLVEVPKVFSWKSRNGFTKDPNTRFLASRPGLAPRGNLAFGVFNDWSTVTVVGLELAYHLGFSEVILIGVDHSFADSGPSGSTVVSQGSDNNHFSPDYFGKGVTWQLPNLRASEEGYQSMKELFLKDKRLIVDATVGGRLKVFPKVELETHLMKGPFRNKL